MLSSPPSTLCRMRTGNILQYSLVQGTYYYLQQHEDDMMEKGSVFNI